jgi:hypothetical protein
MPLGERSSVGGCPAPFPVLPDPWPLDTWTRGTCRTEKNLPLLLSRFSTHRSAGRPRGNDRPPESFPCSADSKYLKFCSKIA